jgi:undecaprenyl phosphate N,N'-diacetylbacillosamine 1-phosphate transferase
MMKSKGTANPASQTPESAPLRGVSPMKLLDRVLKRCLDIVVAVVLLLVTSPLLLIILLLIRWTSPGPALFLQKRVGKDGRIFTIFKFRTMVLKAPDLRNPDNSTFNSDSDPRVTKIGRILRKTSCDELPQLVNILRGDMSLVGPRPELPDGPSTYTASQFARLKVRPGMTGMAAVQGRNEMPVSVRRDIDARYAENWTFWLDLKMLLQTIPIVLLGRGVNRNAESVAGEPSKGEGR